MEQQNTGYPHIDKPWMQFYEKGGYEFTHLDSNTNIADYLRKLNVGNGSTIATSYYGAELTYDEFFSKWDDASRVLKGIGCTVGTRIFNLVPNIPESGHIWMGATQIGSVADFVDPRPDTMDMNANAQKILEIIKFEKADYIVALDKCYSFMLKPIENELKEMGVKNIIVVSASDSMKISGIISYLKDVIKYNSLRNERLKNEAVKKLKFYEALLQKIKSMSDDKKMFNEAVKTSPIEVLRYSDLVKDCQSVQFEQVKDPDLLHYIGHTSGTSGARPKPITITNANAISAIEQLCNIKIEPKKGKKVLHELPYFAPMGAYNNYLLNIAGGATQIEVPEFEINEFGYLILKNRPNVVVATPAWLASLPDCKYLQNEDLSYVDRLVFGGDSMTKSDEYRVNMFMKSHRSSARIEKGHGMSEYCGGACFSRDFWSEPETIGIPMPDTIYSIVDPNVDEKLVPLKSDYKSDLVGELVVSTPALTSGKLDDNEIIKHYEMDGMDFIRTRDIVKMRPNGIFEFESRKDRSFSRFDGYKIKPYEIEKVISKNEIINSCVIVEYFDEKQRGNMPIAHITLNISGNLTEEEKIKIVESIVYDNIIADPTMSSRQIPSKFKIRSKMPLSKNGKIDFKALINEGIDGTEISVEVQETNLSVGKINIYAGTEKPYTLKKVNKQ